MKKKIAESKKGKMRKTNHRKKGKIKIHLKKWEAKIGSWFRSQDPPRIA